MPVDRLDVASDSSPNEGLEPFFELGGPAYRFMRRIGIIKEGSPSIGRRVVVFIAITWVPLLIFTVIEGHAIGPTPRASFLLDFATYARFFLMVPLIFAAETLVGPRIFAAGLRFIQADIVQAPDHPAFHAAALPEGIFLGVAILGAWYLTIEQLGGVGTATWYSLSAGGTVRLTIAGFWYHVVAIPLVQFFLLRWLWRLVSWTLFLAEVSRLRLNLFATHADKAGGLGFLGVAHATMAIFPFALSCVLAAEIAFRVVFEGMDIATLRSMGPLLVAYLVFVELVTFGPLLVLVPLLARVRREGLRSYGMLVQWHNQLFHGKWIEGGRDSGESPLGDGDMSSLIDLGSSFDTVRQMSVFPVGRAQLIQVAVIACLPGVPLVFLVLPLADVLKLFAGVIA
jgi:hypothetical protein